MTPPEDPSAPAPDAREETFLESWYRQHGTGAIPTPTPEEFKAMLVRGAQAARAERAELKRRREEQEAREAEQAIRESEPRTPSPSADAAEPL